MDGARNSSMAGSLVEGAGTVSLAMLRDSKDWVQVLNRQGRVSFMTENDVTARHVGAPGSFAGQTWWDIWPADRHDEMKLAFARALSGETVRFQGFCPTQAGGFKSWDVTLTPITTETREVQSVLVVSKPVQ